MTHSPDTRWLHVANGTCTTRLIEAAGIPGTRSIWADPLYEGPVPAGLTDAELLDLRGRYLAGSASEAQFEAVNDLHRWRSTIEDYGSYDELILWFEHDLFDQLNLVQLLAWVRDRLPPSNLVSLVCVGSFPGHRRFKGLGELTPGELASLLPARQRIGEAQYILAEQTWRAFRAPGPEDLDELRRGNTTALPFLAAALERFLEEYPSTADGLSRSERRLLQLAEAGPVDLNAALPRMHEGEEAYYITDLSLAALVETMSRTSPPLVTKAHGASDRRRTLQGTVTLTDLGRAVLRGECDRVASCGIDRWLGGVRLHADAPLWRWDEKTGRISR